MKGERFPKRGQKRVRVVRLTEELALRLDTYVDDLHEETGLRVSRQAAFELLLNNALEEHGL